METHLKDLLQIEVGEEMCLEIIQEGIHTKFSRF